MKVLILGAAGQVGQALQATAPAGADLRPVTHADCDLTDAATLADLLALEVPELVFNAAAYTAVDKAEEERERAQAINADAVGRLAELTARRGAQLVHISTDFVFDGQSGRPYAPDDRTNPVNQYGQSKRDGERAAQAADPDCLIVRTAWVYSAAGANFVLSMLRLMRERPALSIVADQVGTPTYARFLAQVLWDLAAKKAKGVYHYTESGVASWYDFAVAVQEEALAAGLLEKPVPITPIPTAEYPTPAKRPYFSVLDKTETWRLLDRTAPHWRVGLRQMLGELTSNG